MNSNQDEAGSEGSGEHNNKNTQQNNFTYYATAKPGQVNMPHQPEISCSRYYL